MRNTKYPDLWRHPLETTVETKIPFYNVVNIFLPGLTFVGSVVLLFLDKVKEIVTTLSGVGSTGLEVLVSVSCFAIAYEVGYIIFRFGAIAVEPLLKRLFGWTPYEQFIAAQKAGAKSLDTLSREYAYARTQITLFLALAIATGISEHWGLLGVSIGCVLLFALTARGHIKKIAVTTMKYTKAQNN